MPSIWQTLCLEFSRQAVKINWELGRLMECCWDGCASCKTFEALSDHWLPGYLPDLKSFCPVTKFEQLVISGKNPGGSKLPQFHNYWGHCAPENNCVFRDGFIPLSRSGSYHKMYTVNNLQSCLDFMAWFSSCHEVGLVGPYMHKGMPL